jgi:hypothetical protein
MIWRRLFGYFPASLAGGLASFGAVFALTRLLSPADYGFYALALTTMGIVYTLSITWAEAAAYRFAGEAQAISAQDADHIRTIMADARCVLRDRHRADAGRDPDRDRPHVLRMALIGRNDVDDGSRAAGQRRAGDEPRAAARVALFDTARDARTSALSHSGHFSLGRRARTRSAVCRSRERAGAAGLSKDRGCGASRGGKFRP